MGKYQEKHKVPAGAVTPDAMRFLMDYPWPGNIRELENTVERCVLLSDGGKISALVLPPEVCIDHGTFPSQEGSISDGNLSIKKAARYMEEKLIKLALKKSDGNRTHAARFLEISHRALLYKIKEYGITAS